MDAFPVRINAFWKISQAMPFCHRNPPPPFLGTECSSAITEELVIKA